MVNKISLSYENPSPDEILNHHQMVRQALEKFYRPENDEFVGYTMADIQDELQDRLDELDKSSCLTLLASIEAYFRIDYWNRYRYKKKDEISREMRQLFKTYGIEVGFSDGILEIWKKYVTPSKVISDLKGAINYRHWLAHGRYWRPKLGRDYEFDWLYALAKELVDGLELLII